MGHSASAMLSWIAPGVPRIIYEYDLIYVVAVRMIDDTFGNNFYSLPVCSISPVPTIVITNPAFHWYW